MLLAGVLDAPVLQVAVEGRLVDRVDRADAHGDGRELPEVGHPARVGNSAARGHPWGGCIPDGSRRGRSR